MDDSDDRPPGAAPDPGPAPSDEPPRLLSPAFWAMMVFALVSILASLLFVSAGPALLGRGGPTARSAKPPAAAPAQAAPGSAAPMSVSRGALGAGEKGR